MAVQTGKSPINTTVAQLCDRYDALFFDAFGVLLDRSGPLPGARETISRLNREGKPYWVLSNSAARLPQTMASDFAVLGLPVPAEHIITSGTLLSAHFQACGLTGCRCLVLGPDDSQQLCRMAGGDVVPLHAGDTAEVIVIADQKGFDMLAGMDRALTTALRRLDSGSPLHVVLCNPDLIYPQAELQYGFTAGALALMLEGVLRERYPEQSYTFARLGKPYGPIFEEAMARAGTRRVVMIGDQLATDILGANRAGIDSALVMSGLAHPAHLQPSPARPTYLLPNLL